MHKISWDLIIAILGCGGFWTLIQTLINRKREKKTAQAKACLALLHNAIYSQCKEHLARGYVSIDDQKELEYLYTPYKMLGGNSVAEANYNKVLQLPTQSEEDG